MKPTHLLYTLTSVLLFACSTDAVEVTQDNLLKEPEVANLYFPPNSTDEWEGSILEELNWNTTAAPLLQDFLAEKGTKAFIILKNGKIAVEWYFDSHTQNTSWYWASAGKTLTAFTIGVAQEQGLLDITNNTSDFLGEGWTSLINEKERLISIQNQLTMTSGLNNQFFDCITPDCLEYVSDAGTQWSYHNGPYTLLQSVVANASQQEWSAYFNQHVRDKIGMDGFWFSSNDLNNVYFSTARSMARFGLLNLNNGVWNGAVILGDTAYQNAMKNTSQELNQAYGYLWWLNGKSSYLTPGLSTQFSGSLIPNAPSDTYAGLGKNDQKLYIVPSQGLVVVRMGEDAGEDQLGPSSFDNNLWEKINALIN